MSTTSETRLEKYLNEELRKLPFRCPHLNKNNTTIVIGNPGCGKTTRLIRDVVEWRKTTSEKQMLVSSFSTAAVLEILKRVRQIESEDSSSTQTSTRTSSTGGGFNMYSQRDKLEFFRTIHSLAFRLLHLSRDHLVTDARRMQFARLAGLNLTSEKGRLLGKCTKDDRKMQIIEVARLFDTDIRSYMANSKLADEFNVADIEALAKQYQDWKETNSYYDYTDMLVMVVKGDFEAPDWKVCMFDEAQDFSRVMWILIDKIAEKLPDCKFYIYGDDKQSINGFAGADVKTFLAIDGKVEVLEQSYRCPRVIYNMANHIIQKHMHYYRPEGAIWKPNNVEGLIQQVSDVPWNKFLSGEWLLLFRNRSIRKEYIFQLMTRNAEDGLVPFTVDGYPPIPEEAYKAVALMETARLKGVPMSTYLIISDDDDSETRERKKSYIKVFKECIQAPVDRYTLNETFLGYVDLPWDKGLTKLNYCDKTYLKGTFKAWQKNQDILFKPNVKVETIHGSKGTESKNVFLCLDATRSTCENIASENDDSEAKATFVALTRTKENLYTYKKFKNSIGLDYYLD